MHLVAHVVHRDCHIVPDKFEFPITSSQQLLREVQAQLGSEQLSGVNVARDDCSQRFILALLAFCGIDFSYFVSSPILLTFALHY